MIGVLNMINDDPCNFLRRPFLRCCHRHGTIGAKVAMCRNLGNLQVHSWEVFPLKGPSLKSRLHGLTDYKGKLLFHGEPINDFSGFSQAPLRAVKAIALRGRLAQENHFADLKS
jgi:hypothetical protein